MNKNNNQKRIVVIAGPTGVGESTVTRKIIERYPVFKRLVTATSRSPRLKEKHGVDYYYFSKADFQDEINKGNIIEYQNTRGGTYYGTYKPELEKQLADGFNLIVNTDVVGAKYYKKNYNATTIFITPDSFANLEKRIRRRQKNISEPQLQARLDYARHEIENEADYYDYEVVNAEGKIDKATAKVITILEKNGYKMEE